MADRRPWDPRPHRRRPLPVLILAAIIATEATLLALCLTLHLCCEAA